VRYALKEAKLQKPVLTYRNCILRLMKVGKVSHHTNAYNQQPSSVDAAVIGGRIKPLPGEVLE
jgi:hypothetical protein